MPSQTKENYLKAIYFLHLKKASISITALGEIMAVSKPTVNNMIKKLKALGWIAYEKYKPIVLTEKGLYESSQIVRKHRLTEMFLVDKMGFGWEEVHEIAEEMEHLSSERLFDRMDELLGFPSTDPHGSPIPDKKGVYHENNYLPLSQIKEGHQAELKAVSDSSETLLMLLNEKNISLSTKFNVMKIEPFDKMMIVTLDENDHVALSYEVCKRLLVKPI